MNNYNYKWTPIPIPTQLFLVLLTSNIKLFILGLFGWLLFFQGGRRGEEDLRRQRVFKVIKKEYMNIFKVIKKEYMSFFKVIRKEMIIEYINKYIQGNLGQKVTICWEAGYNIGNEYFGLIQTIHFDDKVTFTQL